DEFQFPKTTSGKRRAVAENFTGISSNFYEALAENRTTWRQVATSTGTALPLLIAQTRLPTIYDKSATTCSVKASATNIKMNPNNMSLQQLVTVLDAYQTTHASIECGADLLPPHDAATIGLMVETCVQKHDAEHLWTLATQDPTSMALYLQSLHASNVQAFGEVARLHAWHRWISASALPQITSIDSQLRKLFSGQEPDAVPARLSQIPDSDLAQQHPLGALTEIETALAA
ncbi:hypothetical protein ACHHYP_14399, partial [Achlya hypogyna]